MKLITKSLLSNIYKIILKKKRTNGIYFGNNKIYLLIYQNIKLFILMENLKNQILNIFYMSYVKIKYFGIKDYNRLKYLLTIIKINKSKKNSLIKVYKRKDLSQKRFFWFFIFEKNKYQ